MFHLVLTTFQNVEMRSLWRLSANYKLLYKWSHQISEETIVVVKGIHFITIENSSLARKYRRRNLAINSPVPRHTKVLEGGKNLETINAKHTFMTMSPGRFTETIRCDVFTVSTPPPFYNRTFNSTSVHNSTQLSSNLLISEWRNDNRWVWWKQLSVE